jgi:hypothetical protein
LVAVCVYVVGQVGEQRVNDYKRRVNVFDRGIDGEKVGARYDRLACRAVNVSHPDRDNPFDIGASGIEAGPNYLVKGVLCGKDDNPSRTPPAGPVRHRVAPRHACGDIE